MPDVHATESVVVTLTDGTIRTVRKDQAFDERDLVVQSHPWLFGLKRKRLTGRVEQATANPGERRSLTTESGA